MDNYRMWQAYDMDQEERLADLPVCKCCGHPIQQEQAVCIEGDYYCEDCEDEAWERLRKDYVEEVA